MAADKRSFLDKLVSFFKRKTSRKFRFNEQFANGKWDGLRSIQELGHYSIITGYFRYYCGAGSLLDLGCGEGVLLERLGANNCNHYMGVDFSDVAIGMAQKLQSDHIRFRVADLNGLVVVGSYDAIIFNESLYYLKDPVGEVVELKNHLNKNGVFIVSMTDKNNKENPLFDDLSAVLSLADETRVRNREGNCWTIKIYTTHK